MLVYTVFAVLATLQAVLGHNADVLPMYKIERRSDCICPNGLIGFSSQGSSSSPVVVVVNANGAAGPSTGSTIQVQPNVVAAVSRTQPAATIQAVIVLPQGGLGYVYTYPSIVVSVNIVLGISTTVTSTQIVSATLTTGSAGIGGQQTSNPSTTNGGAGVGPGGTSISAAVGTPLTASVQSFANSTSASTSQARFATRLIHDGSSASEETGAVINPITLSTTYKQSAVGVHKVSRGN